MSKLLILFTFSFSLYSLEMSFEQAYSHIRGEVTDAVETIISYETSFLGTLRIQTENYECVFNNSGVIGDRHRRSDRFISLLDSMTENEEVLSTPLKCFVRTVGRHDGRISYEGVSIEFDFNLNHEIDFDFNALVDLERPPSRAINQIESLEYRLGYLWIYNGEQRCVASVGISWLVRFIDNFEDIGSLRCNIIHPRTPVKNRIRNFATDNMIYRGIYYSEYLEATLGEEE